MRTSISPKPAGGDRCEACCTGRARRGEPRMNWSTTKRGACTRERFSRGEVAHASARKLAVEVVALCVRRVARARCGADTPAHAEADDSAKARGAWASSSIWRRPTTTHGAHAGRRVAAFRSGTRMNSTRLETSRSFANSMPRQRAMPAPQSRCSIRATRCGIGASRSSATSCMRNISGRAPLEARATTNYRCGKIAARPSAEHQSASPAGGARRGCGPETSKAGRYGKFRAPRGRGALVPHPDERILSCGRRLSASTEWNLLEQHPRGRRRPSGCLAHQPPASAAARLERLAVLRLSPDHLHHHRDCILLRFRRSRHHDVRARLDQDGVRLVERDGGARRERELLRAWCSACGRRGLLADRFGRRPVFQ